MAATIHRVAQDSNQQGLGMFNPKTSVLSMDGPENMLLAIEQTCHAQLAAAAHTFCYCWSENTLQDAQF